MWQRRSFKFPRPKPYDPFETFALIALGHHDPGFQRIERRGFRVLRWLDGELCALTLGWSDRDLVLVVDGPAERIVAIQAGHAKGLLGLQDKPDLVVGPRDPLWPYLHRNPGLRLPRTFWLYEGSLQVVLSQRVSWAEASSNWRKLCRTHGQTRDDLWSAPSPERLLGLNWAELAQCGIEQKRGVALKGVAQALNFLPAIDLPAEALEERLRGLPRVGSWTKTLIRGQVWGDPDAVPLGDYGLPDLVCRAVAGERHGTDQRMLELLSPYEGQRFRVIRYLWSEWLKRDRRGPRLAVGQALGAVGR